LYGYDWGRVVVRAISGARPLHPAGVKESLERVKMLPAACGTPETRISFGKWRRMGWHGAGYLIARQFVADGTHSVFRGAMRAPTTKP
jgi:hypothetical protein